MLRLAASNYSNSAPLIWSFWKGLKREEVEYLPDAAPAKCAEMLAAEKVEIALTPVIEYQRIEDVLIVPHVCIGAHEQVKSVILVTKGEDLRDAKSIALDVSSKTSVALTSIIFREFFEREPKFISHPPDVERMLAKHDVALMIGDPALRIDRAKYRVFDVAEIWREFTGKGFVFAFWLAQKNAARQARKIDFVGARDEGLGKIEEISDFYLPHVSLGEDDFRCYLTENISYTLDDELLKGLELYFRLAHKHNLIPAIKPIQFL
ncbi:MAG: menaquinone biosynthesis protein [Acidobacteriota bacterium]|nr:menaquinone biosynthesis protein [Acidobacteriota bacterium]